jgi:hypothetical protein
MQDMHSNRHYAIEVELPSGERVLVMIGFPTAPNDTPTARVLGAGGRILKASQPSRAGMMEWLAINLPAWTITRRSMRRITRHVAPSSDCAGTLAQRSFDHQGVLLTGTPQARHCAA